MARWRVAATTLAALALAPTVLAGCDWLARYTSSPASDVAVPVDPLDAPADAVGLDLDSAAPDETVDTFCSAAPAPPVVALYRFDVPTDGALINSAPTGPPLGKLLSYGTPGDGRARFVAGRCGRALRLSPSTNGFVYGLLPADTVWGLPQGSIDFWLRVAAANAGREMGILSRDEFGQSQSGHLTVSIKQQAADFGVGLNLRLQDDTTTNDMHTSCGPPIADGKWHHVGINFGGGSAAELYIDGQLQASRSESCSSAKVPLTLGIDGNNLPWLIGAHNRNGMAGLLPQQPFIGELDELRISAARRDFVAWWKNH